jgi:hydrogenase maturation factor
MSGAGTSDGISLALTTDAFVVNPLVFPGGSIGELAVNGTVNDLAVSGARALGLTAALILLRGPWVTGAGLHCMRDATRGGVATVLNEIALASQMGPHDRHAGRRPPAQDLLS